MVSHVLDTVEVVVLVPLTPIEVVNEHMLADCVWHCDSDSVVMSPSLPIVISGHGGSVPSIVNPGGKWIMLIGGGPGG